MYVYILFLSDGTYYTGITNNLTRRLKQHLAGQSKSTKHKLPILKYWYLQLDNRYQARKLEVSIKNRGARRYLAKSKAFYYGTYST